MAQDGAVGPAGEDSRDATPHTPRCRRRASRRCRAPRPASSPRCGERTWTNSAFTFRGKAGCVSICGPMREHPVVGDVVDERDAVRVAHRHAGDVQSAARRRRAARCTGGSPGSVVGMSRGLRIGSPMSTRTRSTLPSFTSRLQRQHAAAGLDLQLRLARRCRGRRRTWRRSGCRCRTSPTRSRRR